MSAKWERTPKKSAAGRVLLEPTENLSDASVEFFAETYDLPMDIIWTRIYEAPETGRYALPIFGPSKLIRGYVLRRPWPGAPLTARAGLPKADTFKFSPEPLQSHYGCSDGPLVLVEDQLSALKLMAQGYDSVALLGKPDVDGGAYSGADRVMEIARRAAGREVLVALDADATDVAFKFARKWRHAFVKLRVVILENDIKDERPESIKGILGL